jgi:surface protein
MIGIAIGNYIGRRSSSGSGGTPLTPPVYVSSVVANTTPTILEMTYDLALANVVPATSAFTVLVNAGARTVNSVAIVTGKVQLTLASAVVYGDTITVAYTKPGSNPLQTALGGKADSITAQAVTNNLANSNFVTTWQTENAGSATKTIVIPTSDLGYDCYVDWGDGSAEGHFTGFAPAISHVYATTGIKTVSIRGTFPRTFFNVSGDRLKILSIENWGNVHFSGSWERAFYGCENLVGNYTDTPDTSAITSFSHAFGDCFVFNSPVNFDTSASTSFVDMFYRCYLFNQSVATFDTSQATDIYNMFFKCYPFNQPVNHFNTANVEHMNGVFAECHVFNQPVNNWDVSKVTEMYNMFYKCYAFNQDLSGWHTDALISIDNMFNGCTVFNSALTNFNTANCTSFNLLFCECPAFNQPINHFNTAKVTDFAQCFYHANLFNQVVNSWDVSKVTTMDSMFTSGSAFNRDLSSWVVTSLVDAAGMMGGSFSKTNYDLLLIAWGALAVKNNVSFDLSTNTKYTAGGAAAAARAHLVLAVGSGGHGWTITDGGT